MQNNENIILDDIKDKLFRININENVNGRMKRLATAGLIDDADYSMFVRLIKNLDEDKPLTPEMRILVKDLYVKLVGFLTKDKTIFSMLIKKLKKDNEKFEHKKEKFFESQTKAFERKYQIVMHNNRKHFVNENEELVEYTHDELVKFIKNKKSGRMYV